MKPSLLFIAVLLPGCVSTQYIPVEHFHPTVEYYARTYDGLDYDIVFDATVQMLTEQGFAIIDTEKGKGIINTDYGAEDRSFFGRRTRSKTSVLVSNAPNGTQILLNFDLQEIEDQILWGEDVVIYRSKHLNPHVARRYYREFFNALEDYLP
ncbi:MAG: hypothetical protein OXH34_02100 [Bacteroidetes bacterium]|nr:hypothetical protein [Bacteroidota bacterium]